MNNIAYKVIVIVCALDVAWAASLFYAYPFTTDNINSIVGFSFIVAATNVIVAIIGYIIAILQRKNKR